MAQEQGHKVSQEVGKNYGEIIGIRYGDIIINAENFEDLPPAPGEPPYKGLTYFTAADKDIFFGREALSDELVEQLTKTRFLTLIGASGSGKSSLLRAGLVPRLLARNWAIHVMSPGSRPLSALAASLTRDELDPASTATIAAALAAKPATLSGVGDKLAARANAPRLLLAVDQFEELFTQAKSPEEQQAFVDNLAYAAAAGGATTVLLSMRADFYDRVSAFDALTDLVSQKQAYIKPMSEEDLVRVIAEPARRGGWQFVEGLVEQFVEDVGREPGRLPLLSHALRETWERRRGVVMTLGGYRDAGGVEGAIAQTAEETLNRLTAENPAYEPVTREIFLALTELGEGGQDTRRIASRSELAAAVDRETLHATLEELVAARLITMDEGQVEVAHEALIRRWPTLRDWLEDNRERLRFQRQLDRDAHLWRELDQDEDVLYGGARLARAVELVEAGAVTLPTPSLAFLQASRANAEREEREKEARRLRAIENERIAQASALDARAATFFAEARLVDARRDIEKSRLRALEQETAQARQESVRHGNLLHEMVQIKRALHALTAERDKLLVSGRRLLKEADEAWEPLDSSGRSRAVAPHIFTIELLNAGSGESILIHYGTPDAVRLVMVNGGPGRTYREYVAARLQKLRAERYDGAPVPIELLAISDRDEHKTGGLLRLLEDSFGNNTDAKRLADIRHIWANLFRTEGVDGLRPRIVNLIDELGLPLNRPFERHVVRPEQGRVAISLPGDMEIIVLGPGWRQLVDLHGMVERDAAKRGGSIEPWQGESYAAFDLATGQDALGEDNDAAAPDDDCIPSANARDQAGGVYRDQSVANLASIVLLLRYQGKSVLFTGDSRGDLILEGLQAAGLLDGQGRAHVDLLTVPHQGSDRNVTVDFFDRVRAGGYLFSGDGRHNNPDVATVAALIHARGCAAYQMFFVNREGVEDSHGARLDAFFEAEQAYSPNYRRIFRSEENGSVAIDLLDPLRD